MSFHTGDVTPTHGITSSVSMPKGWVMRGLQAHTWLFRVQAKKRERQPKTVHLVSPDRTLVIDQDRKHGAVAPADTHRPALLRGPSSLPGVDRTIQKPAASLS